MGKKSRLKAARRQGRSSDGEDVLDEVEARDLLVGLALERVREGGVAQGGGVLRLLGALVVAERLGVELEAFLERVEPADTPALLAGCEAALMSMVVLAEEPGPHRDAARWGLQQVGVTLTDLGVRLLPPSSADEAVEHTQRMLRRVGETVRRVWTEGAEEALGEALVSARG